MRVVVYEDRQSDVIGMKLLLLSLHKHCPDLPVDVIFPAPADELRAFLSRLPQVRLRAGAELKRSGYNVKPSVLLGLLAEGETEAVWIDSDIIIARDFRALLGAASPEELVVTEEFFGAPYQGGTYRSRAWGMTTARALPNSVNSSVLRVTPHHVPLLQAWDALMADPEYGAAQQRPWQERPIHHMGDQEVLTALLESDKFSSVPVKYLKRGRDVIHCFQHQGYALHQMVANLLLRRIPSFVHGQGAKPWRGGEAYPVHTDTSPYTLCAAEYIVAAGGSPDMLQPRSRSGRVMRRVFRDDPWRTSLPFAAWEEARNQRVLRTFAKRILHKP